MRLRRVVFSTMSPPHSGHLAPVGTVIDLALWHLGNAEQARKRPNRPRLITMGLPHFSQTMSVVSTGIVTISMFAVGQRQHSGKRIVELAHHRHPLFLAGGDAVQILFHVRCEPDVDDLREVLHQEIVDEDADLRGHQPASLDPLNIATVLDGRQDRRVGRRAPDAVLLQGTDQRGLGVARRRLGEVLLGEELQQIQTLVDGQRRQRLLPFLILSDDVLVSWPLCRRS